MTNMGQNHKKMAYIGVFLIDIINILCDRRDQQLPIAIRGW